MSLARMARSCLSVATAVAMCALGAASAGAQGSITGRVTAQGTNEPLGDARVLVLGSNSAATSAQDGKYVLNNVRPGAVEIQVLRVGYQSLKKSVTVPAAGTVTVDFQLAVAVVRLQDVVTTATGQQRKVELGSGVATLGDVATRVETTPVTDIGDLLIGKMAGVNVNAANMTGAAPTVRIRGAASISLSNAPIVVIDGVTMQSGTAGLAVGGTTNSFLNNLNPEEIEDIEIVKGPSAATLYGTAAANGVIVVTTKKGRAGNTRWTWYGENGGVSDRNKYPNTYAEWGHNVASGALQRCFNATVAAGTCAIDSVTTYNVLTNPSTTPINLGRRQAYGTQVNGGSEAVRYFLSGTYENEVGPLHMPEFSAASLAQLGVPMQGLWQHPEQFQQENLRANLNATLSPNAEITINVGFAKSDQHLPQTDNNTFSFLYSAYQNPGFNRPLTGATATAMGYSGIGSLGEQLNGYGTQTPRDIFQDITYATIQRLTGSSTAQWRPFQWMQNEGTIGMDFANLNNYSLCAYNTCPNLGTTRQGTVSNATNNSRNFQSNLRSTGTWQARPSLNFKTTIGADYLNQEGDGTTARGITLPPGAVTVGQAATVTSANSTEPTATKTLGWYAQEQLSFRDRLFLTGAVRNDQNSAFGSNFQSVTYPKGAVSWIVSDEGFFPKWNWLNQLRLRTAYGASGVQPGATSSLRTFAAATTTIAGVTSVAGTNTPGLLGNALGNPNLKPEKSEEWETGFDTRVLNNRVNIEITYYSKQTHDALINLPIAPSAGPASTTVLTNIASTKNAGIEGTLTMTVLDTRRLSWDMTVAGSHLTNKVVSLGLNPATGLPYPTIGTGTIRDSIGLPIFAETFLPYTVKNPGTGPVGASMVTVGSTFQYFGYSFPRDIGSIQSGLDLFGRKLRVNMQFDYKGGYDLFNNTGSFYNQQTPGWSSVSNPNASQFEQGRAVAERFVSPTTTVGYLENGSFWRFRELSAVWNAPDRIANLLAHASSAQLVASMRNIHVWTKYTGIDPESSYSTGDTPTDFSTINPPSYFLLRLNLHY